MNKGKNKCEILKEIRIQIAQENEIPLEVEDCSYDGDCRGTCPRCEAELHYLEQKLSEKNRIGKKAMVAGISFGIIASLTSCNHQKQPVEENLIQKDSVSTLTIVKDTLFENVPSPGLADKKDRRIITHPIMIRELAGVSPDIPEVDTHLLNFVKNHEIIKIDTVKVDTAEIGKVLIEK